MTQKPDYERGHDDAWKAAITWLHERAKEMNDPKARDILNSAAFGMGVDVVKMKARRAGRSVVVVREEKS